MEDGTGELEENSSDSEPDEPELTVLGPGTWSGTSRIDRAIVWLYHGLGRVLLPIVILAFGASFLLPLALTIVFEPEAALRFGVLTVVSVFPATVILLLVWVMDGSIKEPFLPLALTFFLAILLAGIAAFANGTFRFLGMIPAVGMVLYFFLVVGPVEEGVKLLAVRMYAYRQPRFSTAVDGAVYGAAAGLGFATVENFLYITVFAGTVGEPLITAVRSLSGPGHVIWTALAGFYLGLAKYNAVVSGPLILKGLLIAIGFHAIHNSVSLMIDHLLLWWAFQLVWHGIALALLIWLLLRYRSAHLATYGTEPAPLRGQ